MVSGFGIRYMLNDLYVAHRLLHQHFFFIFFHSTVDVGRSMFIFSLLFDQTGNFGGQRLAET
jgi:hypothetical protein